jgi:HSP20 family molecular chaperone IbpA
MMLRELAESAGDAVLRRVGRVYGRVQESTPLEADVLESDETLVVVFDAPGVQSSDVQVRFVDDRVLVRIDRFREFHEGYEMRFPGRGLSLDGEVTIPDDVTVDPDAASATLTEHGTLEIRLPKQGTEGDSGDERENATSTTKQIGEEGQSNANAVDFDTETGDEEDGGEGETGDEDKPADTHDENGTDE